MVYIFYSGRSHLQEKPMTHNFLLQWPTSRLLSVTNWNQGIASLSRPNTKYHKLSYTPVTMPKWAWSVPQVQLGGSLTTGEHALLPYQAWTPGEWLSNPTRKGSIAPQNCVSIASVIRACLVRQLTVHRVHSLQNTFQYDVSSAEGRRASGQFQLILLCLTRNFNTQVFNIHINSEKK